MTINCIYIVTLLGLALSAGAHSPHSPATAASSNTLVVMHLDGVEFSSDEGRMSIVMPPGYTEPEESISPMATPNGNVDLKMYSSTLGSSAAMVAFANMDGKLEMEGKEKAMLDGARDNVLKTMNGALLKKEKAIMIDGHPGRRLLMSMKSGGIKLYGRLEMYMAAPMMYEVMYVTDKRAALESATVNDFFSSFTLH